MANSVKNLAGGDTGNANNGRTVVLTARTAAAAGLSGRVQTLDSPGFSNFSISDFETSPPGADLDIRFDDVRYYTGDSAP